MGLLDGLVGPPAAVVERLAERVGELELRPPPAVADFVHALGLGADLIAAIEARLWKVLNVEEIFGGSAAGSKIKVTPKKGSIVGILELIGILRMGGSAVIEATKLKVKNLEGLTEVAIEAAAFRFLRVNEQMRYVRQSTELAANTNNLALPKAPALELFSTVVGGVNLTGIERPSVASELVVQLLLWNRGPEPIVLANESGESFPAYRFYFGAAGSLTLKASQAVLLLWGEVAEGQEGWMKA